MQQILNHLSEPVRNWVSQLKDEELASILNTVYITSKIPPETKVYGSAELGKHGEKLFELLCDKLPTNYKVINTSKQGKNGDFVIEYTIDNIVYKCLVDIKNYKHTVPKKEIEKFYEDLSYSNYDGGLLISYQSKFVGIAQSVIIEEKVLSSRKYPIMFVSGLSNDLLLKCVELLFAKIDTNMSKSRTYQKIENCVEYINNATQQSNITRRLLSELQTSMATQIQKCQENLLSMEVQIKHAVDQMIVTESKEPTIWSVSVKKIDIKNPKDDRKLITYKKFNLKDVDVLETLLNLPWASIELTPDYIELKSTRVSIQVYSAQSKTYIQIMQYVYDGSIEISRLIRAFKEKIIANLSDDLVYNIGKLLE
jgi:hypothetical protein